MRKKIVLWLALGVFVLVGVVVTVIDYKEWKRLEMQNYGQGWKDLKLEAMVLSENVNDEKLGIKYKTSLELRDKKYDIRLSWGNNDDIGEKIEQVEKPGGRGFVIYKAGKLVKDKVVVLEFEVGEEDWGKWENTINAIFESIE